MTAAFDNDVDVSVEFAPGFGPMEDSPTWVDISTFIKGGSWYRGRSSTQQQFPAGSGSLTLDNTDGRFYPWNTSSPYSPNVTVGVPVRIRAIHNAVTYPLFRGFAQRWVPQFPTGTDELMVVAITEMIHRVFNRSYILTNSAISSSTTVLTSLLAAADWPTTGGLRDIGGTVEDIAVGEFEGTIGGLLRQVEEVEQGSIFQSAGGVFRFVNRVGASGSGAVSNTPQGTFGPDGVELTYIDVVTAYDDDSLINEAIITPSVGDPQEASDASSIDDYGASTYAIQNPMMVGEAAALNVAEWIVSKNKDVEPRLVSLTIDPAGDPDDLWPEVLDRDLRDVITVEATYPGSSVQFVQDVAIESVAHAFEAGSVWVVTYGCHPLSDLEQESFWVLGTSQLGIDTTLA